MRSSSMPEYAVRASLLLAALLALCGCQRGMQPVAFHADGRPPRLRDWHVVEVRDHRLVLNQRVLPYELNTPLFTDYAHKLRTVWMPQGTSARYEPFDALDFPVGTIISKTFFYPRAGGDDLSQVARTYDTSRDHAGEGLDLRNVRLVETRLLVRRKNGWATFPYVWNREQTEARLARTGAVEDLVLVAADGRREPFHYVVPDENQCSSCHTYDWVSRRITPIGPKARHLNRDFAYPSGTENQLAHWARIGYLKGLPAAAAIPRNAVWDDTAQPLEARARAYLDINCGHCHNPRGAANTTGLTLDASVPVDRRLGVCKPPVAAGRGTGDRMFDIVPGQPDASIIPYRLHATEPGVMMPELGRSTSHTEGEALIRAWIASMKGRCR